MCDFVFYYNNDLQAESYRIFWAHISDNDNFKLIHEYNEFSIDVYLLLDNPEGNIIAFDWDNTFSEDVEFFSGLMDLYLARGFKPIVCTLRDEDEENISEISGKLQRPEIELHLTSGVPKLKYMQDRGYLINLWIDDLFPSICKQGNPLLERNRITYG